MFNPILLCPFIEEARRFSQRISEKSGNSKLYFANEKAVESSDEVETRRIEPSQISSESQRHQRSNIEIKQPPSPTSGGAKMAGFLCRKSGKIISLVSQ